MKESAMAEDSAVHVVDDNEGIRSLVVRILESVGLPCTAWDSPGTLLAAAGRVRIDALVVDIRLAGMSGLELVRQLRERGISAPVVFISGVNEVTVAVEAMKLGAYDFLPKPFAAQTLIDAVQAALARHRTQEERDAQQAQARTLLSKLSPREKQVLLAIVDGKANKVMASELGLSEKTIEEHRKHVMTKLGASSVADVVKLAVLGGACDPASIARPPER